MRMFKTITISISLVALAAVGATWIESEFADFYEEEPPETYSVEGQILFYGEPPMMGVFEVGLCEIIMEGTVCAYSLIPPAPKSELMPDGTFEILDVPPGDWGLVFDFSYFFQIMPHEPDGYSEITFAITDEDMNLGALDWDDIPCDLIPDWRCGNVIAIPIVIRGVE